MSSSEIPSVMTGRPEPGGDASSSAGTASDRPDAASEPPPPPPKKADGELCGADGDCESGHCLHDICCEGGDCCLTEADCPTTIVDGIQLACNEPSTCQGKGGAVSCQSFLCVADGDVPNDSACTTQHMAKECAPYKPVFCNGMVEQEEPLCPTSCTSDSACIEGAHCDDGTATCVMDTEDGGQCSADEDCASHHCDRNICCESGDCCSGPEMCLRYASRPMCVRAETCTGSLAVPVCEASQCGSREMPSPNACDGTVVETCGLYPDVVCRAGVRSPCATSCRVDSQCKPDAYCRLTASGGECQPKLPDGEQCTSSSQCQSSCNHGFCCADTDPNSYCCGTSDDCSMLNNLECVADTNSCDAVRTTATCTSEHRCRVVPRNEPNACTARPMTCGDGYKADAAACPLGCGCQVQGDCADGYVCAKEPPSALRGRCVPDGTLGAAGSPGAPGPNPAGMGGAGRAGP